MTDIRYVNSAGTAVNLLDARLRIQEGNFHVRRWTLKTIAQKLGVRIEAFNKDPQVYPVTIELRGSLEERKRRLDELNDVFENDIARETMGTLYFGESYIKCIVLESNAHVSDNIGRTEVNLSFYCPYPNWIKEQHMGLLPRGEGDAAYVYPKRYPYRYSLIPKRQKIVIDHYKDSDFQMIIYGPTESVDIIIGEHPYKVNHAIESGEYMVIDTRQNLDPDKRCYVVHANGDSENVYNDRDSESSIFQKIPPGIVPVYYNRNYGIDITVYVERGEPRWS